MSKKMLVIGATLLSVLLGGCASGGYESASDGRAHAGHTH